MMPPVGEDSSPNFSKKRSVLDAIERKSSPSQIKVPPRTGAMLRPSGELILPSIDNRHLSAVNVEKIFF